MTSHCPKLHFLCSRHARLRMPWPIFYRCERDNPALSWGMRGISFHCHREQLRTTFFVAMPMVLLKEEILHPWHVWVQLVIAGFRTVPSNWWSRSQLSMWSRSIASIPPEHYACGPNTKHYAREVGKRSKRSVWTENELGVFELGCFTTLFWPPFSLKVRSFWCLEFQWW